MNSAGSDGPAPPIDPSATQTFSADRLAGLSEVTPPVEASAGVSSARIPHVPGFTILGKLGEGGMGTVWLAHQHSTKRDVALKLMRSAAFGSERDRLRFEREVEISAQLQHPNIAQVYESGESAGIYFYALQLVKGLPLDQYVAEKGCDTRAILRLMLKICAAVQHAHQRGVIHRDLKPGNILVDEHCEPFVLDFGLAKATIANNVSGSETLTHDGMIVGTPAYMAPEQAAGKINELDTRTDVYSLGVILFRLLTGELPHATSGTKFDLLRRIVDEEVRRPRSVSSQLHWELEAILLKALAKDQADRYSSAAELAGDLTSHLQGEPISAHAPSFWYFASKRMRKHAAAAALTFAMLLSAVFGVGFYIVSIQNERDNTKEQFDRAETNANSAKRNADVATKNEALAIKNAKDAEQRRREADAQRDVAVKALDREARQTYWTTIRLANDLIKRAEFGEGLRRLLDTPKAMRGWEWGYLVAHCPLPDLAVQAHADRVVCQAVSPNQKQLVTCGADGKVAAWDTATMERRWQYRGTAAPSCLAYAPNGKQVAIGIGSDIVILDASSGRSVKTVRRKSSAAFVRLQYHPDGSRLLTCLEYANRKNKFEYGMFETTNWTLLPAKIDADRVNGAFDAGGEYFLTGGVNRANTLEWRDPLNFKMVDQAKLQEKRFVQILDVVLDTRRDFLILLEVFNTTFVKLAGRNIVSHKSANTNTTNRIIAAAVDWGTNQVGMVSATGEVRVCDLDGQLLVSANHASAVTDIASLGNGRFVTSGRDGRLKIWNVENLRTPAPIVGHSPAFTKFHARSLAMSADSRKIACQSSISRSFGLGELNNTSPWTVIQTNFGNQFELIGFTLADEMIIRHTFSAKKPNEPGLSWICLYAVDGRLDPLLRALRVERPVRRASSDAPGRRMILTLESGGVEIRDLDSWKLWPGVEIESPLVASISSDGKRAAALNGDGTELHTWEVETGKILTRVKCRIPSPTNALFHPDCEHLAISDRDGNVTIFDIANASPPVYLQEHTAEISRMQFSPDGNRLFTCAGDHSIRVWDWRLGRDLLVLTNGKYEYFDVVLTDGGRTLAATSHVPKIQLHQALPWEFDETSSEFTAAVAKGHLRDKGRRLADEMYAATKSTSATLEKIKASTDMAAVTRQAAIDYILHRAFREEKLIIVNSLTAR